MFIRILLFTALILPNLSYASSSCTQAYTVLGITEENGLKLWFHEQWEGECSVEKLQQVVLSVDTAYVLSSKYMELPEAMSELSKSEYESPEVLSYRNGVYYLGDSITVKSPRHDSGFLGAFYLIAREHADGSSSGWRKFCQRKCFDDPVVSSAKLELLYEHPNGLYKNYLVYDAVYFASKQLLAVVTYQPTRGDGLDAMHGLLIYKLTPDTAE